MSDLGPHERILIVGASHAGLHLAAALRQRGDATPVTLIGEEAHAPYQRPPLSKDFLSGSIERESLALRSSSFYESNDITLLSGERVIEVAAPAGPSQPGYAVTSAGRELSFTGLALTVGASPRRLRVAGADLAGIVQLRTLDDAERLRSQLSAAERVVVVGGGFIGLETAAIARAVGARVTVVEAAERLASRAVAPVVSEFYRRAHERRGTTILTSTEVTGFSGQDGRVTGVALGDGTELPADLVVVGIGVTPRTDLAEQLQLRLNRGIVVDEYARTSAHNVVAAGDCTVVAHPFASTGFIALESVNNAVAQAEVAAATLTGELSAHAVVPRFWSNQDSLRLQIAGLSIGYDQTVVRGDIEAESFSVLYYREGQLLAADTINSTRDYMVVRKALELGINLPADAAADTRSPLKDLLSSVLV